MSMEHRWNDINKGQPKNSEKPVPVPLCPPQSPHWLAWIQSQATPCGIPGGQSGSSQTIGLGALS